MRLVVALVLTVVATFGAVTSVLASEKMTGDEIQVAGGRQIRGDLFVFGRNVNIAGTVDGDLIGAAETVTISGTINGSINLAVRTLEVSGLVTGSAHVAAQTITVSGAIDGDLLSASSSIDVAATGQIGGDLLITSGDLTLSGSVGREIRGSADDVDINGAVGGHVRISADSLSVGSTGRISGDMRYASNNQADIAAGSLIAGRTIRTSSTHLGGGTDAWSVLISPLTRLIMGLLAGLVLLVLLPRPVVAAADSIRHRLPESALTGLVGLIGWPVLAVLLSVILVGIPIVVAGTSLLLVLAYLSQVFVGIAIGRSILPRSWQIDTRGYNILAMAIGMILIGALRALPVPFLSPLLALVIALLGIGGALHALRTTRGPALG